MPKTHVWNPNLKLWKAKVPLAAALHLLLCITFLSLGSCTKRPPQHDLASMRDAADSIVKGIDGEQSLDSLSKAAARHGNIMLEMRALKKFGTHLRENNRFAEAIACHRQELKLARHLADTIAIVQALNNIGTNFRRMGALDEAVDNHFQALHYCEAFSNRKDSVARKNRVVSLNGIGNVSLTLGDTETADSVFRAALAGERQLGSALGQAINYANIGSIFERNGQIDSAWAYYRLSMEANIKANSQLGQSLCYAHFGRLNEKRGAMASAIGEYKKAYEIMRNSTDRWHALESGLALASMYVKTGDYATARKYIDEADKTAHEIHSLEHQSQVAMLKYEIFNKAGDCRNALQQYKLSTEIKDSVSSEKNLIHMQKMRIRYEHERRRTELDAINKQWQTERQLKWASIAVASAIAVLAVIAVSFMLYVLRNRKRKQLMQQQLDEMRLSFFTNITHEFRTPLTVILGYSRMMENGELPPDGLAQAGRVVSRQGGRLLSLINQLLDIQKVKSAVGRPDWRHGNIVLFVSTIVESYLNLAHTRHIKLIYAPEQQEAACDFVPDYIQKIVCNLLSNALKFTPADKQVIVTISIGDELLTLSVADSGNGISAEDKQRIFEPFYQTESNRLSIGSGVGLALVKQIVVSLQGEIKLDSTIGKGSTFTVKLPTVAPSDAETKPLEVHGDRIMYENNTETAGDNEQEQNTSGDNDARPLVLIVEDNHDVAQYMSLQLQKKYRLIVADDGEEGLRAATEYVPDLIITDLMMPRMDGYQLCKAIKEHDTLNHIPVIIVTAKTTDDDKLQGLKLGVDAYLYKPFNAEELVLRVENLLEKQRLLRERYQKALAEHKSDAANELSPKDREFIERLNGIIVGTMTTGDLNVDNVASALCMSGQQLRRKLNAITGGTPASYIRNIQMQEAQRMIDNDSDMQITEVAMKCGFYDTSHFTRVFKQVTGCTPSQYRNRDNAASTQQ